MFCKSSWLVISFAGLVYFSYIRYSAHDSHESKILTQASFNRSKQMEVLVQIAHFFGLYFYIHSHLYAS